VSFLGSRTRSARQGFGKAVRRREDARLLVGQGRYSGGTGQMLATTFMDYAIPRADAMPAFTTEISEVPSTSNPLGLRGGGEGGTTPALGAVVNAIVDALAELGVEHVETPATPERVWRAIRDAQARSLPGVGVSGAPRSF
jgi:xanthine dehydrogenase molybdopterin-binding subunit B